MLHALPFRHSLPLPDGSVTGADRQHAAFMYAGISADTLELSDGGGHSTGWWLFLARPRHGQIVIDRDRLYGVAS